MAEKWLIPKCFLSSCPRKLCPCFKPQWIVVWTHLALPGSTLSTHANCCLNTSCLAWQFSLHTCQQLFEQILPCLPVLSPHMPTVVWRHLAYADSCLNTFCLACQCYLHTCKQLFKHILLYLATQPPHVQTCLQLCNLLFLVPWLQPCSLLFLDYSLAYLCWLLFWITDLLFRKCETEHGRGPHQYDRLIWMLTEHIATTSCSESDTVSSE